MPDLTQGTIISGLRSEKYPGVIGKAIIVSARCDLANCKVSHVYYVIAIPCDDWLLSDEGFSAVLAARVKEIENEIQTKVENGGLDWVSLQTFSDTDFEKVILDKKDGLGKNAEKCLKLYRCYRRYQMKGLSIEEKKRILSNEKNSVKKYMLSIANGQVIHFVYLPKTAYCNEKNLDDGLIVDLQELDRFDVETAKIIIDCNMDIQSIALTSAEKEKHDRQFLLTSDPGYAIAEGEVTSPWLEYVMQHFANSFIRIGVDGPQKTEINKLLDRVCGEEGK